MKTYIRNLFLLPTLIAGLSLVPAGRVTAQTFTTLHSFGGYPDDGASPVGGVLLSGNTLYGTAAYDGNSHAGTVFKVNVDGTAFTNLYTFTAPVSGTNSDGAYPWAGLILSGNTLYGTAESGGSSVNVMAEDGGSAGNGTVFKLNTDGTSFVNLHSFAGGGYPGSYWDGFTNSDGAYPQAGVILSGNTLYGTAFFGGSTGGGTVFKVNTDGTGFMNLRTLDYGSDGSGPFAGLLLSGNTLYGTTSNGGIPFDCCGPLTGAGTVFKLNTDGTGFMSLHTFTWDGHGTGDARDPSAGVILSGNTLYGTTYYGGSSGNGTVFKVNTDGTAFTILYSFSAPSTNSDGAYPSAGVILSGNTLYGTTWGGGSSGKGTVFAVKTDGTGFMNLHSFTGGSDGSSPYAGLTLSGNTLYGTTRGGGSSGNGTVFSLSLAPQLTIHYVNVNSASPASPYTDWATAATTIQDAVDAAVAGDQILVTNGVYQTGGRVVAGALTNRVAVTKPVTVQSVNGAAVTVIRGYQVPGTTNGDSAVRCVYLTNGAALVGFTLTNGATRSLGGGDEVLLARKGGGVSCESPSAVVSNCTLSGNSAVLGGGASGGTLYNCTISGNSCDDVDGYSAGGGVVWSTLYNCTLTQNNSASFGGGAALGTLNNCTLSGNSADDGGGASGCTLNNCTLTDNSVSGGGFFGGGSAGGGASECTLNNCVLTGNSAAFPGGTGGGAWYSTLNNCIVYYNSAAQYGDNYYDSILSYSCTTPLPANGIANFTNAPLFVDYAGGNQRLQSNSPCINAGSNASAPVGPDLDGNPRIAGGTVDIGAYEFQSPQSFISYVWLHQYGLPINGSTDNTDADGDGLNNWQEWRAGTNPSNASSALRLLSPLPGSSGFIVSWLSVSGRNYFLERGTDFGAQPSFLVLATNIAGQPGATTFTDTNAAGPGPFFYRVGVKEGE